MFSVPKVARTYLYNMRVGYVSDFKSRFLAGTI